MSPHEDRDRWEQVLRRLEALEEENQRLRRRLTEMELRRAPVAVGGLQTAVVTGQGGKGTPAALDAQGRVEVETTWSGQKHKLKARVATPWLAPGGGIQFLPRVGQGVYLAFEDGRPELPIVVGYVPSQHDPLPYNPTAKHDQPTSAQTEDKDGKTFNPPTGNQYKNIIRSAVPGDSGKVNEIAMVDQAGHEQMSLSTPGDLRLYSEGDCYQTVKGNYTRKVAGNLHERIEGKTTEVHMGDREYTIMGNYKENHHEHSAVWLYGDSEELFMGNKASLTLGNIAKGCVAAEESFNLALQASANLSAAVELNAGAKSETMLGVAEQNILGNTTQIVNGGFERVVNGLQAIAVDGISTKMMNGNEMNNINGVTLTIINGVSMELVNGAKITNVTLKNESGGITIKEAACHMGAKQLDIEESVLKAATRELNLNMSALTLFE